MTVGICISYCIFGVKFSNKTLIITSIFYSSINSLISLQCIDNTVRFLFQRFLILLLLLRSFLGVFLVERVYIYGGTRVSLVEEGFLDMWTIARVTIISATVTQFGYTQVICCRGFFFALVSRGIGQQVWNHACRQIGSRR